MSSYRTVRTLSAPDAACIAGLIDGEGTITLTQEHKNEKRRLVVSISSTERGLLDFVLSAAGAGKVTSKRTYQAHHAPSYAYRITNRHALTLLGQIAGYLKSYKAGRAALALSRYAAVTPRNGRYTPELLSARTEFEERFLAIRP